MHTSLSPPSVPILRRVLPLARVLHDARLTLSLLSIEDLPHEFLLRLCADCARTVRAREALARLQVTAQDVASAERYPLRRAETRGYGDATRCTDDRVGPHLDSGSALMLPARTFKRRTGSVVEKATPRLIGDWRSATTTRAGRRAQRNRCTAASVPLPPPPTIAMVGAVTRPADAS